MPETATASPPLYRVRPLGASNVQSVAGYFAQALAEEYAAQVNLLSRLFIPAWPLRPLITVAKLLRLLGRVEEKHRLPAAVSGGREK